MFNEMSKLKFDSRGKRKEMENGTFHAKFSNILLNTNEQYDAKCLKRLKI